MTVINTNGSLYHISVKTFLTVLERPYRFLAQLIVIFGDMGFLFNGLWLEGMDFDMF